MKCYDFKEGDNIIFRLEIKNDTDEDAILPPFSEVLGPDVLAHSSAVFVWPWFDVLALYFDGTKHYYSEYFYKKDDKSPLPKGEYFSEFDIKLNEKTIIGNRKFDIR